MNRSSIARRYLPLAAVIAVQALIVALVPSKAPQQGLQAAGATGTTPGNGYTPGETTDTSLPGETTVLENGTAVTVTGGTTTGGGTGSSRARTGGGGGGGGGAAAGDTSHCVAGRQFDPAKFPYAPPCVPKFAGDNGGATYQGVTKDSIKVVHYRANLGAAVDALLTAQGANPSAEQVQAMLDAVTKLINENYELYGRKYQVKVINGQCNSVPPDYPCLRGEFRRIIQQEKPFAIVWNTSLASPAFDEMSKLGVVNLGGWGFRDSFNQAHTSAASTEPATRRVAGASATRSTRRTAPTTGTCRWAAASSWPTWASGTASAWRVGRPSTPGRIPTPPRTCATSPGSWV
jgi:hypothetical protein